MKDTPLKKYLPTVVRDGKRGITHGRAAKEIGISREYFTEIANGRPTSPQLGDRIEHWSGGRVPWMSLVRPQTDPG